MKTSIRDSKGFTIVELMIVVAIVGILTTVAKTNYDHFVAKARQSEAKIGLSAIYSAEKTFFAEFYSYTSCLTQIGYMPDSPNRYYLIGFSYYAIHLNNHCGPAGDKPCDDYKFKASPTQCSSADPNHSGWPAPLTASNIAYSASVKEYVNTWYNTPVNWHLDSPGLSTSMSNTDFVAGAAGIITSKPPRTALKSQPNNVNSTPLLDGWVINSQKQLINLFPGI